MTLPWSPLGELRCALGESPVWDAARGRLMVVDVTGRAVHAIDPGTGAAESVACERRISALIPAADGGWWGVSGRDIGPLDLDTGVLEPAVTIGGPPDLVLNDAVCGRDGVLYVGSIDRTGRRRAALHAIDPDGRRRVVVSGVGASNGVDTSPDGLVLYHADTFAGAVTGYPLGHPGRREVVIPVDRPDGLTVDAEGGLWVALWGSGEVHRYTADGVLDRRLVLPVPLVSSVAFGGTGLRTLFVTTARSDGNALSGAVFAGDVGVMGRLAVNRP